MADHFVASVRAEFARSRDTVARLEADEAIHALVGAAVEACLRALRSDGRILFAGNGGSAADCQHLAGEFVSRFAFDRPGLPGIALTTDTSVLTAIGNDYGYEHVFARQVQAIGRRGDVLFGISTSGRSRNILTAFDAARRAGIFTIGMTGQRGAEMAASCDLCIVAPAEETPKVQEAHIVIGHTICALVERAYFRA